MTSQKFAAEQPAPEPSGPDYAPGARAGHLESAPATVWLPEPEPEPDAEL
jgi:hypothetical protein